MSFIQTITIIIDQNSCYQLELMFYLILNPKRSYAFDMFLHITKNKGYNTNRMTTTRWSSFIEGDMPWLMNINCGSVAFTITITNYDYNLIIITITKDDNVIVLTALVRRLYCIKGF